MSKQYAEMLNGVASAVGQGLQQAASHSARAAATANGVTAGLQKNQGTFNQASANNANSIATDRIAQQWGFNSAQAAQANQFSMDMWQRSADFNAEQAQIQRDWLERMDNTKYQRAIKDMESAGLNPILAVTGGGISTGTGSGSAASINPISGQQASGSVLQGMAASEGMGSGQMEYMGGLLGLLSAGMSGLSSAIKAFSEMGLKDKDVADVIVQIMGDGEDSSWGVKYTDEANQTWKGEPELWKKGGDIGFAIRNKIKNIWGRNK